MEEAIGGQSKKDFLAKMGIANKEARETHYWHQLLRESKILSESNQFPIPDSSRLCDLPALCESLFLDAGP
ncbi:MAG: four helix bundle protein [Opitutae bacterium]|nr:four helix bundle protein [Opitutae bacterium]